MKLSIPAWRGDYYLSLSELLLQVASKLIDAEWYLCVVEAAPEPGGEALENFDNRRAMNIFELLHIITPKVQIVDGEVIARFNLKESFCLRIQAIDSTSWDIETECRELLSIFQNAYPESEEVNDDFYRIP
jgi:hypothetical protein